MSYLSGQESNVFRGESQFFGQKVIFLKCTLEFFRCAGVFAEFLGSNSEF